MADRHTIQINPSIEALFHAAQLDVDCMGVSHAIEGVKSDILELFDDGDERAAVELYAQLMYSIAKHFVEDEHWQYFDDYYSPDYDCIDIYRHFNAGKSQGKFTSETQNLLDDYLSELEQMEACKDYGIPSVCYRKPTW